ncbi:MAG: tetratricopeptide repeat protein [bacterium]|nr:tetratricopeptide repeat protein [bacterium]
MRKSLKLIRYLILGGIFLVPFIPLIVPGSLFFPFIAGKNFFFRILVEILLGLWLVLAIYNNRYKPHRSWILISMIAFVFVMALSSFFGENLYRSLWSNYERMEGLITHLHLLAYFFILVDVLRTEKLWKRFFNVSLGVSAIIGVYGALQLVGKLAIHQGNVRLDATLGNASYLAIYMVFHIFIALFYFARERQWYKWFYIPLIALQSLVLYHTATRGAILGLLAGVALAVAIIAFLSKRRRVKIFAVSAIAFMVLSSGGFLLAKNSSFVKSSPVLSRFASISIKETTTQSRFVIWKMSWEGFKEKPILGWGPENYNLVFDKYYEPILYKQETWFDRAHNVFFDRLTTNGILGLFAYLAMFASAFYYLLFKKGRSGFGVYDSAILSGLLAAYLFHNLFVFDNITSFLLFFSVLGYVHFRSMPAETEEELPAPVPVPQNGDDYKKPAFAAIIAISTVFIIYTLNVPAILASRSLISALQNVSVGNVEGALGGFKQSISYRSFGSGEAREQLANFAMRVLSSPKVGAGLKNKVFNYAVSEMKRQVEQSPDDIRYLVFLGSLYNKGGEYDLAIETLKKAIKLSPKKQHIYFELGTSYLNKKEYEKGAEAMKTAFELEPSYGDARKIYAIALIYDGKSDLAEKLLKEKYGTSVIADARLVNAYNAAGEPEKIARILEKFIEKNPNNLQYRVSLAAAYSQTGERKKAIEQLQKAIELDPKFKKQGEYYIKEIRAGRKP